MGANCPWNGAFLTSSWPSWWSWALPPSFPAMSTSWGWFLPFTVSHFDLPVPRYAVAKAQNGNFGDSSCAVWPAMWAKSVKMVKTFSPLEPSSRWLGDGQKKITFRQLWPKLWGFKVQRIKKWRKSAKFECRFVVRLTFWPARFARREIKMGWVDNGNIYWSNDAYKILGDGLTGRIYIIFHTKTTTSISRCLLLVPTLYWDWIFKGLTGGI